MRDRDRSRATHIFNCVSNQIHPDLFYAIRVRQRLRKELLRRELARGECLKRAAFNVGISYGTAKAYLRGRA